MVILLSNPFKRIKGDQEENHLGIPATKPRHHQYQVTLAMQKAL